MKSWLLLFLFVAFRALAADDPGLLAAGEWSKSVGNRDGYTIRGRLLICQTPNHASAISNQTDVAVYLELQEFSPFITSVRVHYSVPPDAPGLRCEMRDSKGALVPESGGAFSGSGPASRWIELGPYCSARLRASLHGGGRLADGSLSIMLASTEAWEVHPNATNGYYLSGTFSAPIPPNFMGVVNPTNRNVWYGTLALPPVKLPINKP